MKQRNDANRRAMTLVEVLAVVVILGLMAGTLAVGFGGAFGKGKQELAKTGIGVLVSKIELYRMEHNDWPTMDVGLAVLSHGQAQPTDAYFAGADVLLDPWDRPYLYVRPGPDGFPFEIVSHGSDGQPGGTGEAADISSTALRGRSRS